MYFWDNQSNAAFWIGKRKRDNPDCRLSQITCDIDLSEMLDLTDVFVFAKIRGMWENYLKKTRRKRFEFDNVPLGVVLDTLPCSELFKVKKMLVTYKEDELCFKNKTWNIRSCSPTSLSRLIYAVTSMNVISNKEMEDVWYEC